MIRIAKIDFMGKGYGGNAYERQVEQALSNNHIFTNINILVKSNLLYTCIRYVYHIIIFKFQNQQILLLNFLTAPFFSLFKKNNVLIIHHIDWRYSKWYSKIYQIFCWRVIVLNKKRWYKIIVVSEYWKIFLEERGFKNIEIIYNVCEFETPTANDIEFVLNKYGIGGSELIYIGNPQVGKGWLESYNALKSLNYKFIVTGNADSNIELLPNLFYLDLPYKEYLCVLKACKFAVLMSRFEEGWNRAAHECMQLGVPVIGSGKGGMKELLQKGHQLICTDFIDLPNKVVQINNEYENFVQGGSSFTATLDIFKFNHAWKSVFK